MANRSSTSVQTNLSYLGSNFNSPFSTVISVFEYSNEKFTRAKLGGAEPIATFVLPAPREFTTQLKSSLEEDLRAKEVGSIAALFGFGDDEVAQAIASEAFSETLGRIAQDLGDAVSGRDSHRVMDYTETYYTKSEKRRFTLSWDLLMGTTSQSDSIISIFDSLSGFSLPNTTIGEDYLFRVSPPSMVRIDLTSSIQSETDKASSFVRNSNPLTNTWLSNPKLCLISSVTVKRDVSSIFVSKRPTNIVGILELVEIEPLFRSISREDSTKSEIITRSQAILGARNP